MTETRIVDPFTGGEKGQKTERMDLLPWDTLLQIAAHYGVGAEKYEDRNWERGYAWSLSFGALQRHVAAWWQGEDIDEDTGSSHLAAAAFHILTMLTFQERQLGTDDRPRPEPAESTQDVAALVRNRPLEVHDIVIGMVGDVATDLMTSDLFPAVVTSVSSSWVEMTHQGDTFGIAPRNQTFLLESGEATSVYDWKFVLPTFNVSGIDEEYGQRPRDAVLGRGVAVSSYEKLKAAFGTMPERFLMEGDMVDAVDRDSGPVIFDPPVMVESIGYDWVQLVGEGSWLTKRRFRVDGQWLQVEEWADDQ